jgi:ribosome-binding factor A
MNERRIARLQQQIKQALAQVLLRDLADPKLGLVTITRVEVDSEFTICKAYWSVLGNDKARAQNEAVLRRARGLCQRAIGQAIHTRTVPQLEFHYDEGVVGALRVNKLLEELQQERAAREQAPAPAPEQADAAPPAADPKPGETPPRSD